MDVLHEILKYSSQIKPATLHEINKLVSSHRLSVIQGRENNR